MGHKGTAAALLPALLLGMTACQSAAAPAPVEPGSAKGRSPAASAPAGVGDTVDDGGTPAGEHLRITLRGQVDPALGVPAAPRPAPGTRWVGVELTVVNVGGTAHESAVARAWVVDDRGRSHPAVDTGELTTGLPLARGRMTVGEQRGGWLAFAVPHGSRAVALHCRTAAGEHRWAL
ncbi:DUF4352 domain-containing protein [Streptomyces sanyensis]|uniref:DUF4352 domain-containing protein n=1 Tax=Streptomyces sanyensis TaxID=568869 RepID=UPI003D78317A